MTICCDLPRHALLIHFGKKIRRQWPLTVSSHRGVEIALDESQQPPHLLAIHFIRHRFYLPFVSGNNLSVSHFNFRYRKAAGEICIDFGYHPPYDEVLEISKGLSILLSQPQGYGNARPTLHVSESTYRFFQ
jgi:hypothetical protein